MEMLEKTDLSVGGCLMDLIQGDKSWLRSVREIYEHLRVKMFQVQSVHCVFCCLPLRLSIVRVSPLKAISITANTQG